MSGVSTHVTVADRGLAERGWETLLVHGSVQPDERQIDLPIPGVRTEHLPALARPVRPTADARAFLEIMRTIRRYRPHVIHTHHSKAGLLGRSAAIMAGVPRVHTIHGHVFEGYFGPRTSALIVTAEKLLARRTSRLIALSEAQRDDLVRRGLRPPQPIRVVQLGLDLDRFSDLDREAARAVLGVPTEAFVVVTAGRLVPIKRLDRLIRAFRIAHDSCPESRLYVIGDGAERPALEAAVTAAGLASVVEFRGWSTDSPSWYAAADVVALSSDNEGTPLTLIEAAAAGRPAVATGVGGVGDVVADGVTGFVVPVEDELAFADRLILLARDPALRARMGAAGPGRAARFGAHRLIDDLEHIYLELIPDHVRPE